MSELTPLPEEEFSEADELAQLVSQAQQDPEKFTAVYDEMLSPVYGYVYSRVMDAVIAEYLTAQTFLSALETLPDYQEQGYFRAWLLAIARRKISDHFSEGLLVAEAEPEDEASSAKDFLGDVIQAQQISKLTALIHTLEEDKQELIRLHYVAALSFAEIGALLGKSEDAVMKALFRVIGTLHHRMEAENE